MVSACGILKTNLKGFDLQTEEAKRKKIEINI